MRRRYRAPTASGPHVHLGMTQDAKRLIHPDVSSLGLACHSFAVCDIPGM